MSLSQKIRLVILLLTLGFTVGCDQTSKHIARAKLGAQDSIRLPGGIGELRLTENPGAFLSMGASLSGPLRKALTAGVGLGMFGILVYVAFCRLARVPFIGLALAWSGGVSNLIDRTTRHGSVTDFIFLRVGPLHTGIFNLADVAILLGIAMLAVGLWKQGDKRPPEPPTNSQE